MIHLYPSLRDLAAALRNGETRAEALATRALEQARATRGVFISVNDGVVDEAAALDRAMRNGEAVAALAGVPLALKDLFDVRGEVTRAGSRILARESRPAAADCEVVARLRAAGLLFVGRTNMSEFAFSGMGMNPHFGTPPSVWDRDTGRLPGGSSSGSALSVAEGVVCAAMGSDTAGSCRIPAAFNGIVGVKPSYGRLSLDGVYPLSPTSDAPGPMAVDVDSCFLLDRVLTGAWDGFGAPPQLPRREPGSLRLRIPESVVMEECDDEVARVFERAVAVLRDAGANVEHAPMPVIDDCVDMFRTRAVAGYEAWQLHREMMEQYGDEYDPFVYQRIRSFSHVTGAEQQSRYAHKAQLRRSFSEQMTGERLDAVLYPTVACVPPPIAEAQQDPAAVNLRCLRNTASANYFDGCSISLPCHRYGEAPVGLMISAAHGGDDALYAVAGAVEQILNPGR